MSLMISGIKAQLARKSFVGDVFGCTDGCMKLGRIAEFVKMVHALIFEQWHGCISLLLPYLEDSAVYISLSIR